MQSLSPTDGSAQAITQAEATGGQPIASLERDLDRVSAAVQSQTQTLAHHLNGTLLAQSLLLVSYLVVLIGAWSLPLPGKHWLLAAIAGFAVLSLVLATIAMRSQTGRLGVLRARLKSCEEALERLDGRTPVLSRGSITSLMGRGALSLLPALIVGGWIALSLYALALPVASDTRPAHAEARADKHAVGPLRAAPRPAAKAGAIESAAPETVANESPLAGFLRRATQTPATTEAEAIRP